MNSSFLRRKRNETYQGNISRICLVLRSDLDHRVTDPCSSVAERTDALYAMEALESRDEKSPTALEWRSNLSTGRNKRRDNAHIVYNSPCVGYLVGIKQMVRDLPLKKAEGQ